MYNGDNPVALRSQEAIRDAFIKLLKVKPFNKISVKEINKEANLARQTFYLIFSSKEEIVEYHLNQLFKGYSDDEEHMDFSDLEGILASFFDFFLEHKIFLKSLFENKMQSMVTEGFKNWFMEMVDEIPFLCTKTNIEIKYIMTFLSGAMVEVMSVWLKDDDVEGKELSSMLVDILDGNLMGGMR